MPVPQELGDLPYADYLEPYPGDLARGSDYASVHVADSEFENFDAGNSRINECVFSGVSLTDGTFARTRLSDVWFSRTRWVSMNLTETEWLDIAVLNSFFAGVQAFGATLRRVTFQECKINTLNLRGATIHDTVFDRCELIEVDLAEAMMTNVTFPGSKLHRMRLDKATLKKVDFRGAVDFDVASGFESLRSAIITDAQLFALAPALAQTMGIVVKDR